MDSSAMAQARNRPMRAGSPGDPFATSLRRLRWPVVLAWIPAIVLLHGLSSSLRA
jgi:hypothetical protein